MKKDILYAIGIIAFVAVFSGVLWGIHILTRPNFTLTSVNGGTVTLDDIRAKPSAVFFGYTSCPDVCPATLVDMEGWLTELGKDSDKINIWFVTIDPERDTQERLHDYIANVSDQVTGLRGTQKETDKALKFFNAVAQRVEMSDGDYTFDHTAAVILIKKNGVPFDAIPFAADDATAMDKLKTLINSAG